MDRKNEGGKKRKNVWKEKEVGVGGEEKKAHEQNSKNAKEWEED